MALPAARRAESGQGQDRERGVHAAPPPVRD